MLIIENHGKDCFDSLNMRRAPIIVHEVLYLNVGDDLHVGRIDGHTFTIDDMAKVSDLLLQQTAIFTI